MAGDGGTMGWKQPGIAFSPYIHAKASSFNIFVNNRGGGGQGVAHKEVQMVVNGQKNEFSGKWQEMAGQWGGNSLE